LLEKYALQKYTFLNILIVKLQCLSKELYYDFQKKYLNSIADVLVEDEIKDEEGKIYSRGVTSNYIKVIIPDFTGKKGEIVSVKLNQISSNYVVSSGIRDLHKFTK
jgi:threonylcarbamoyladenosine tRNA methylthiotransferase MtaB